MGSSEADPDLGRSALGASLTDQERQTTLDLLGAGNLSVEDALIINAETVFQYIEETDQSTHRVYSSVLIEGTGEGQGIDVDILTPENITQVSESTYENVALTAGITDLSIKVGSLYQVTGEGALVGVYELLKQAGQDLEDDQVASGQDEIALINAIIEDSVWHGPVINVMVIRLKLMCMEALEAGEDLSVDQIRDWIVRYQRDYFVRFDDKLVDRLADHLYDFAQSNAASDENVRQQLNDIASQDTQPDPKQLDFTIISPGGSLQFVTPILTLDWGTILAQLPDSYQLIAPPQFPYESSWYADEAIYHPIIPALFDELMRGVNEGADALEAFAIIYNDSFIAEAFIPDLTENERQTLNYLRLYCTILLDYYSSSVPGIASTNRYLLERWDYAEQIQNNHPAQFDYVLDLGYRTGWMPQACSFAFNLETQSYWSEKMKFELEDVGWLLDLDEYVSTAPGFDRHLAYAETGRIYIAEYIKEKIQASLILLSCWMKIMIWANNMALLSL